MNGVVHCLQRLLLLAACVQVGRVRAFQIIQRTHRVNTAVRAVDEKTLKKTTPGEEMKEHFLKNMKNDDVPLFKDWNTYSETLPKRLGPRFLNDRPFYCSTKELDSIVDRIFDYGAERRPQISYISAYTKAGKTTCGLPLFLASTKHSSPSRRFTHYVYMAFYNNLDKHFEVGKNFEVGMQEEATPRRLVGLINRFAR